MTYVVYQGEAQPPVTGLIAVNGAPQPLTGVPVNFRLWQGGVLVLDAAATVTHADAPGALAAGQNVQYAWVSGAQTAALAGAYEARFVTNPATALEQSTPAFPVVVASMTPGAQPVPGPVTPWTTGADVQAAQPSVSADDAAACAQAASEILYQLSGLRFPGEVATTVRPCARSSCSLWGVPSSLAGAALLSASWSGASWSFAEPFPGMDRCGCAPLPRTRLAYPVTAIDRVLVDGATVPSSAYQVAERRWLERVDGGYWPACQNLGQPDTTVGTWSVAYRFGASPPVSGVLAARELAGQLARSLSGLACALPAGTTQVTRAGITVNRAYRASLRNGDTGLTLVDAFLAAYARGRRSAVWSPEAEAPPRRVQ